jgi:hypothetical protein
MENLAMFLRVFIHIHVSIVSYTTDVAPVSSIRPVSSVTRVWSELCPLLMHTFVFRLRTPSVNGFRCGQKLSSNTEWYGSVSLLRHYATSRKVAGSIPDVIGFFNWPNPSNCTMALGSIHPLTEMSTRILHRGKRWPAIKTDLTAIC